MREKTQDVRAKTHSRRADQRRAHFAWGLMCAFLKGQTGFWTHTSEVRQQQVRSFPKGCDLKSILLTQQQKL
jgi:hypothetical protein